MANKTTKKAAKKKTASKATQRKTGLGRGLDALLGQRPTTSDSNEQDSELQTLGIEQLQPGQYQPRSIMDQGKLQELADSIAAQGIVQPIVVRRLSGRKYEIKLSEVPVLVKQVNDQQTIAMALIENIQREDLNPLEEASALQRLIDEFKLTHAEAAEAVGRSRVAVSNLLRLLDLSKTVKDLLNDGLLEMGHARCLLSLERPEQAAAAKQIIAKKMSVRQAEALVKAIKNPTTTNKPKPAAKQADIRHLEQQLTEKLCAQVDIQHTDKGKGKLVIHYHNSDELDGILKRIK